MKGSNLMHRFGQGHRNGQALVPRTLTSHPTCTHPYPYLTHPQAVIFVIPAEVTSPVSHFEALQGQPLAMPPAMRGGSAAPGLAPLAVGGGGGEGMFPSRDKDFARHYLLLQDGSIASEAADRRCAMWL